MTTNNSVSVITRTKDRTLLLERAIKSVLSQTHSNWQHIIVNDGGETNAVNLLVNQYRDQYGERLLVIHNEKSRGMEAASNIGVRASDGRYVVIHDDDDSWQPSFLEQCILEYESCNIPTVRGVLSHITQIFERIEGDSVTEVRRQEFDPDLAAISIPQITEINRFLPISFLFERSVFDEIGLYDESLPVIGDWEFNFRFFLKYDVVVLKEALANYHIRTESEQAFQNTVTSGRDEHLFHRALVVNKHVREDLAAGRITPGELLAQGDYFYRISASTNRIGRVIDAMKSLPLVSTFRKLAKK
jgi:glycosyltransferase involved in cell wall biosynthesis